jgi:hypothetical protein
MRYSRMVSCSLCPEGNDLRAFATRFRKLCCYGREGKKRRKRR